MFSSLCVERESICRVNSLFNEFNSYYRDDTGDSIDSNIFLH